jgi:hypothetical protein
MKGIDLKKLTPSVAIEGEDATETKLLKEMLKEADGYLLGFAWCREISESYLGIGVGGVIAVFLFKIVSNADNVDEWLWVIVGDLPPAYLVVDCSPDAACALDNYIGEVQRWVDAVLAGKSVKDVIPVNAPPTVENARQLQTRLDFLKKNVLTKHPCAKG